MKASQLRAALQAAIAEHGDLDVYTLDIELDGTLIPQQVSAFTSDSGPALLIEPQNCNSAEQWRAEAEARRVHIAQQEAVFAQMRKEGRIL